MNSKHSFQNRSWNSNSPGNKFHSSQSGSWHSSTTNPIDSNSHSSVLLDITSDRPMFPDAVQDTYVKSFCSKGSATMLSSHQFDCENGNKGRSASSAIPSYISTMKHHHGSHLTGTRIHQSPSPDKREKTQYTRPKGSSNVTQLSSSPLSEPPIQTRTFQVGQCDSFPHSEPLRQGYTNREHTQGVGPCGHDQYHQNFKVHRSRTFDPRGSLETNSIYNKPQGKQYISGSDESKTINRVEQLPNYDTNKYESHSAPSRLEQESNFHMKGSNQHETKNNGQTFMNQIKNNRYNRGIEDNLIHNQVRDSFDETSTIPSEEILENSTPMDDHHVPHSIKVTQDMKVHSSQPSKHRHERINKSINHSHTLPPRFHSPKVNNENKSFSNSNHSSSSVRITPNISRVSNTEVSPNSSRVSNTQMSPNISRVSNTQVSPNTSRVSNAQSDNFILDTNIPQFQVIGQSQGTISTAACTSMGSTSFSESDKYLHSRSSSDYDSDNHISRYAEITPISIQSTSCHPQLLSTLKTPISSNTSTGTSRIDSNEKSNSRLEILQEIAMAMEMRQKAKLSNESEDYTFWANHIQKLNKELEEMKFQHNRNDFIRYDDNVSKSHVCPKQCQDEASISLHSKKSNVESQQSPSKQKPISILKNGKKKTRTIKIRAPSDMEAGHLFTININGEEIRAKVPLGGVRRGEIFPISVQVNKSHSSPSKPEQKEKKIKVRAPTNLEEGFIFTVKVKGGLITAPVPKGGVKEGEIFLIPSK